jgi:hypothetical protein
MKTFNITILLLFFIIGITNAQYIQDIQGKPLMEMSYTDVTGTPYLYDSWTKGSVELENGAVYRDIELKFSVFKDELFFKNTNDETMMAFVLPVKSFLLERGVQKDLYRNSFPDIDDFNQKTYYQVLFDGNIKLLFKAYKSLLEIKPYNSATTEKKFSDNSNYYLFIDGTIKRIKPSKKEFLEIFKDKTIEIDSYLKNEKVDFKNNKDLTKLFEYYSSL